MKFWAMLPNKWATLSDFLFSRIIKIRWYTFSCIILFFWLLHLFETTYWNVVLTVAILAMTIFLSNFTYISHIKTKETNFFLSKFSFGCLCSQLLNILIRYGLLNLKMGMSLLTYGWLMAVLSIFVSSFYNFHFQKNLPKILQE